MRERERFHLLLVRGDGRRVLRLAVSRRLLVAGLTGLALWLALAAGSVTIYGGYLASRRDRQSLASVTAQLAEQQALMDLYQTRIREARAEIDGWRQVHAKIWEPFGPDAGPGKRGSGIGGGTATGPLEGRTEGGRAREELSRLSSAVKEEGDNLRALEQFLARAGKVLASLPSRWPVRGPINSDFGTRRSPWAPGAEFHGGMDIGAPVGTPVRAPAPGRVVFAGRQAEYGITAVIEHANDTRSVYGHLSRLNVKVDQDVERGQVIAWSGNTGRSSGPHLHYEIQVKGEPVNPHSYLWE
jgi:murein DD-endopeptidase MepM/ murein hydrolase activator NlpD